MKGSHSATARGSQVAARIQHHPSRTGLPRRLIRHLGAFEDVEVVSQQRPGTAPDAWRVHRACLEAMPETASHLLVLQDDALPVPGFASVYLRTLEQHPDAVLCLFTPGFRYLHKLALEVQRAGMSLTPMRVGSFVPCVAISYPRSFVHSILEWADQYEVDGRHRPLRGADDGILARYCRTARIQPLLMIPSIVEHDDTIDSIGKAHRRTGAHRKAALLATSDPIR